MVGTSVVPLSGMFFIVLLAASALFTFIVALIARFATRPRTQRLSASQEQAAELERTLQEKSAAFAASDEIAKTEIKNLKIQIKEMAETLQKQEIAFQEARTDLSASQKRAEGLSRHIAEVQAEEQKNLKLLEATRQKEQTLAAQLANLQTTKELLDDQLAKFRIKYEVASATIETLQNDIKEIRQAARQEPDKAIEKELTDRLRLAEERLAESQSKFESFKREAASKQEEIETEIRENITTELELKDELKELEGTNAEIESECRQLKAALQQEENRSKGLENEKQDLVKELESVKKLPPQTQTVKHAEAKENEGYDPLQAWIRRFSLGHLGERIWITRDEFESLEEEIKKKNALIEKSHQQNQ